MQLETFSPNSKTCPITEKLLPFVKSFAYPWFNIQAEKRKYQKNNDRAMPVKEVRDFKEKIKKTSFLEKKSWAKRLLSKLVKDVVVGSREDFIQCIRTRRADTPCVSSQPDNSSKMRRIDCFKQSDKIWRLDLVAVILFKGIPLDNTDSERLDRVEWCTNALCINPYHLLVVCKELDLYVSHHVAKSAFVGDRASVSNDGILMASVHTLDELLSDGNEAGAGDATKEATAGEHVLSGIADNVESPVISKINEPTSARQESANAQSKTDREAGTDPGKTKMPPVVKQAVLSSFELPDFMARKKLPKIISTLQPQSSQGEFANCQEDVQPSNPLPPPTTLEAQPLPSDERDESSQQQRPQGSSGAKPKRTNDGSNLERPRVSAVPTAAADSGPTSVGPCYTQLQLQNASGVYIPHPGGRIDFSKIIVPASLAPTITSILPQSTLTIPGPFILLRATTPNLSFAPPVSGTTFTVGRVVDFSLTGPGDRRDFAELFSDDSLRLLSKESLLPSTSSFQPSFDLSQQPGSSASKTSPMQISTRASGLQSEKTSVKRSGKGLEMPNGTSKVKKLDVPSHFDEASSHPTLPSHQTLPLESLMSGENASKVALDRTDGNSGNFWSSMEMDQPHVFEWLRFSPGGWEGPLTGQMAQLTGFLGAGDSPSSDGRGGSPAPPPPQTFTEEFRMPTENVPRPVAILKADGHSGSFADAAPEGRGAEAVARTGSEKNGGGQDSSMAGMGGRLTSSFSVVPIAGPRNMQAKVGYPSGMVSDGNGSNPVLSCLHSEDLLSPIPPFAPPSSPPVTPKSTPRSTPVSHQRWCTPYQLEAEVEGYSAWNMEEIGCSNESSSGTSSDRRSQVSLNLQSAGHKLPEEEENLDEGDMDIEHEAKDEISDFKKSQQ